MHPFVASASVTAYVCVPKSSVNNWGCMAATKLVCKAVILSGSDISRLFTNRRVVN